MPLSPMAGSGPGIDVPEPWVFRDRERNAVQSPAVSIPRRRRDRSFRRLRISLCMRFRTKAAAHDRRDISWFILHFLLGKRFKAVL